MRNEPRSIPFVDLAAQMRPLRAEIDRAIAGCIDGCRFIGGEPVARFEEEFAAWLGVDHCVGCANGTDALELMLAAFDIGLGDEVVVPALTWISTAEAVSRVGATPVFVEVDPVYFHLDAGAAEAAITPRTKALLPVHLYGQAADLPELRKLADAHGLRLLEDAAQAHGAAIDGAKAGTVGHAAAFSFYPGKNLGALGDAGCVVTNDPEAAARVRRLANHGQAGEKHVHRVVGRNSRLDAVQAAVLSVKLPHVDGWNAARRERAAWYAGRLADSTVTLPVARPGAEHVWHLYVIRHPDRDGLRDHLAKAGVSTAVHYPTPLPLTPAYAAAAGPAESWAAARRLQGRILSLPMYPELDRESVGIVADAIESFPG
ncbi:MAG: DegT/DnrJ/EryC1/StrS family aminotransferase [Planctomycetota bacterium]